MNRDDGVARKDGDALRAAPFTEDVFDGEYYDRRKRSPVSAGTVLGIVFAAVIVAAVGWYVFGSRDMTTVVVSGGGHIVRVERGPYKVKPDDPGGMQVENQDKLIYDRVAKGEPPNRVENLLPAPEAPRAPPVKAPGPAPKPEVPPQKEPAPSADEDPVGALVAEMTASDSEAEAGCAQAGSARAAETGEPGQSAAAGPGNGSSRRAVCISVGTEGDESAHRIGSGGYGRHPGAACRRAL